MLDYELARLRRTADVLATAYFVRNRSQLRKAWRSFVERIKPPALRCREDEYRELVGVVRHMVKRNKRIEPIESPPANLQKQWIFRLIAVVIPSLLGLIAILGVMIAKGLLVFDDESFQPRIQAPPLYLQEPGFELTGHKYLYDSQLGWRNIPDWEATTHGRPLSINSLGFRGRQQTAKKLKDVTRILILGDSYAWGYGVADDEVFAAVLEEKLDQPSNRFEVFNTGVSGWGTDQEYLFYINEGHKFEPDVVVLAFFLINDPKNNYFARQYGLHKPVFLDTDLTLGNVPVPKPQDKGDFPENSSADPIRLTLAIVARLAADCAEQDCPLVVLKFGLFLEPASADFYKFDVQLKDAMQQIPNLHFLDLDEVFSLRSIKKQELLVGNDDGHWNAFGHLVTAEVLEEYISGQLKLGR